MAVTPNYGWPVPVATDYVKDGWEAISDLGNAIDTTVAGLGSGLSFISRTTVTNQSNAILDNIFTTTYKTYLIVIENLYGATYSNDLFMRFRFGATTQSSFTSSGQYSSAVVVNSGSSTVSSAPWGNQTSLLIEENIGTSTQPTLGTITFQGVGNTSEQPFFSGLIVSGGPAVQASSTWCSGFVNTSNTYKGLEFYAGSGNIWATIAIYGMAVS